MSEDQRPPDDSSPAKRLGDFDLLREIGRGGMGVVYEARQISLKRRVALKVLPPALGMSAQAKQRFEREAQAAAKLHHTHIVPVHAIGEHDGHHFYAMDLIDGQSLDHVLRDMVDAGSNPLMETAVTQTATELRPQRTATSSQEQATTSLSGTSAGGREWFDAVAKLMAEVADGLHYAHGRGVIHRDVKPANLMLSREGHLSITDFGLARLLEEPGMTVSGSFLGTPAYMAPEQIAAGRINVDHRADIYSLGAVLYEMLTMQRPFGGQSREQVLAAVMTKDPRPPRRFNGKIPVDLETICLKALEKDPDRRYQTAGELAQDLRQHLQGGVIAARRAGIARRTWKSIRRHPTATLGVVAVLVVVAASVVGWQAGGRDKEAQQLVSDARLALREGTYREGLRLIDRAVALDPDSIEARLVRARLLIVNYRFRLAADEARSVLQTEPQNYAAHAILAGLALYPVTEYRLVSVDPEPHLRVVEASAPESAEAHYLRGLGAKDTKRRIELLDRALDLNPSYQLASVARRNALGQLKDHELELSEADRLIAIRPKSAQGWRFKANAYRLQQDFENARTAIERAMAIDDLDPWNYVQRFWILSATGEHDDALSDLTRAIELDPEHALLYTYRAGRLNGMGRFEEAIADARKSIELNPDGRGGFSQLLKSYLSLEREDEVRATIDELRTRAEGWFNVGAKAEAYRYIADFYRQLKDYDQAMEAADRAIETDPDDFLALVSRAKIHRELGDAAAAEADCDAAARIELDEPQNLLIRGTRLWVDCNEYDRVLEDFNRVIELTPKWAVPYLHRGRLYEAQLDYGHALSDFEKTVELAPQWAAPHYYRAAALVRLGREEEVLAAVDTGMKIKGQSAFYYSGFAWPLFWLGQVDEAVEVLDRAIELHPDDATAYFSRAGISCYGNRPCDEIMADLERGEKLGGPTANTYFYLSWIHAADLHVPCPDDYDADRALQLARKAVEQRPTDWALQAGYGLTLYRNGRLEEASEVLAAVLGKLPESSNFYGTSLFTAAMIEWELGNHTEARAFYDRGVANIEATLPRSPLNLRFKDEAARLLGVQP